jgi:hypothetical protein
MEKASYPNLYSPDIHSPDFLVLQPLTEPCTGGLEVKNGELNRGWHGWRGWGKENIPVTRGTAKPTWFKVGFSWEEVPIQGQSFDANYANVHEFNSR